MHTFFPKAAWVQQFLRKESSWLLCNLQTRKSFLLMSGKGKNDVTNKVSFQCDILQKVSKSNYASNLRNECQIIGLQTRQSIKTGHSRMRRSFRKILFQPTNIPNVILFTVPNFHCNTSSSFRVKKKTVKERKTFLCALKRSKIRTFPK